MSSGPSSSVVSVSIVSKKLGAIVAFVRAKQVADLRGRLHYRGSYLSWVKPEIWRQKSPKNNHFFCAFHRCTQSTIVKNIHPTRVPSESYPTF